MIEVGGTSEHSLKFPGTGMSRVLSVYGTSDGRILRESAEVPGIGPSSVRK
jgi:hypothetical protein